MDLGQGKILIDKRHLLAVLLHKGLEGLMGLGAIGALEIGKLHHHHLAAAAAGGIADQVAGLGIETTQLFGLLTPLGLLLVALVGIEGLNQHGRVATDHRQHLLLKSGIECFGGQLGCGCRRGGSPGGAW